ncbi:NAD+ synthase [Candidatus Liberibacter solanacearum]|uniref:Glutamine-dependent NAD(+) synthetase n=1 Tax=Candidatus Liberibacter solanacearum TaxID=556287 RepID=A0A1V2N9K9_9HYPH|nr:NAD+ synthase [Candidatus Liberibacter solanacearum]ONI58671.1 NAD+ synthase [Candidatus Liberibacter solanacearum]ONI60279.1 NAD+ synthase [Candidatus Liberibacter solanacearum]
MSIHLKIAIAQLNPTVGDVSGNIAKARQAREEANRQGADIIIFTELFISGYPAEDLILKKSFIQACYDGMLTLKDDTRDNGAGIIIGFPRQDQEGIFNSVAILDAGKIVSIRDKIHLPNYNEFHEKRTFISGYTNDIVVFRENPIGILICEDIWENSNICRHLKKQGAKILLTLNASPYCRNKLKTRHEIISTLISHVNIPIVYVNQVGGQDELIFDGASFCFNGDRQLAFQMKHFEEQNLITQWYYDEKSSSLNCISDYTQSKIYIFPPEEETDYNACVVGLRDYVKKNNFHKVIIGLSGGIDSALCATIAVDALGKENVQTIMLPYKYTSNESLEDAAACAKSLDCRYDVLPIHDLVDHFFSIMSQFLQEEPSGIVAENIQSRIRGNILMTLSNKSEAMLLTTNNKSEISIGYGTLYGDMSGGFNPLKDLYKTKVYKLAYWRNAHCIPCGLGPFKEVIPPRILEKAPSAELRPNQIDEDSLPPYAILDNIIEDIIENNESLKNTKKKYSTETMRCIENLLYRSEYKRRQSPPGTKITSKSFGRDRLYPISNKFRDQNYE